MSRGKVVRPEDVKPDLEYERSMIHRVAVSDATVGSEGIGMTRGTLRPGERIQAHYHINAEMVWYILSGHGKVIFGMPGVDAREDTIEPGVMVYVPRGEIHSAVNLSDTEPIELVASYNVCNGKKSGKILVEP